MTSTTTPTLYDRLGGSTAVQAVVEELYKRLLGDPKLAPMFEEVRMHRLKYHQLAFLKVAFGKVPEDMDVPKMILNKHMRLFLNKGLNESHFDLVAQHLVASLQHLNVAPELIEEAVGVVSPLRTVFEQGATLQKSVDTPAPSPSQMQVAGKPTLMDRLGGNDAVRAAVDGLYKRLLADPDLAPFFETVNMARLRQHQIRFMKIAFAQVPDDMDVAVYMKQSHAFMIEEKGLNGTHFDMVAAHFVDTLKELKVSEDLIDEAVGVIGPLRVVFENSNE